MPNLPAASVSKRRLEALSEHLVAPIPDQGMFEGIPKLKKIAGDSDSKRLKGKVAIITGCNSPMGIGRATAHQYAQNGCKAVYICDYDDSNLATHKREIESLYPGVAIETRQFDAGEEAGVKAVCDDAIKTYGRLDIFFANAGIVGAPKVFTEIESDEFMNTMRVNTLGVFLGAKFGSLAMRVTGSEKKYPSGSIIGTASVAGLRSNAGSTDYSVSKAGVVSLAQTISYQLAGTGIRINAICPGVIETGMTAPMYVAARERGTEKKIGQLNPLRRGAHADEVARVALFLGSDEASYVNGQAWAVDGGLSSGHPFVPGKLA
jgi:NAD(P)-dependent dehydrogenase (short-subunit alcohol dehydrogenase family)